MSAQFFKFIFPQESNLHIPDEFVVKYGADLRDVVFLEVPSGTIWKVRLQDSNGTKCFKEGWNQFIKHYSIASGYLLLFQYNGNSHFDVLIFDLSASQIKYLSPSNRHEHIVGNKVLAGQCDEVHPSTSKVTITTNQHSKKKTDMSLDASYRRNQLNEVKIETKDLEEHCNRIAVVDSSVTKRMTTTIRHDHEKKTTLYRRYQLRSKVLKELMAEKIYANEDVSQKAKMNKANNVEEPFKAGEPSASNRHNDKKITHHRYALRSKQCKDVKVEKGEETNNGKFYKGKDSTGFAKSNWNLYFNPHFIVTMQPAYVSRDFQLDIPINFFKKFINCEETIIILRVCNDERIWRAKLFGIKSDCPKIEPSGWREFVMGNNLKEHDTCVFELTHDGFEPELDVTILRATTTDS